MRRVALLLAAALLAAGGVVYVVETEPAWYARLRYPLRYEQIVTGHARNYRLDAPLLAAVIYQESRFDPRAKSAQGAIGLMQLLPGTAQGIARRTGGGGFVVADLYEPELNVRYGAWYLRHLLDKYGDEETALAAYNAGQGQVDEWRSHGEGLAFAETRAYVARVEELRLVYARVYASELGAG